MNRVIIVSGTLYLCATPIGNLGDMTFRAVEILKTVDLIAAEDTRNTLRLLNHFDIKTPMTSYHQHNLETKGPALIEKLTGIDIKYSRLCTSTIDEEVNLSELFLAGNALFYDVALGDVFELRRANEVDIGLVPYPKYDVTQPDYLSRVENSAVTAIPITARDPDRTSVIVEALAVESYNYVLPAFYEITLMSRYSRDSESAFMLDIAFAGRRFDLADAAWGDVVRDRIAECLMHGNGYSAYDAPTLSELAARYKDEIDKLCADCAIYW